jgi:hypothetical protein
MALVMISNTGKTTKKKGHHLVPSSQAKASLVSLLLISAIGCSSVESETRKELMASEKNGTYHDLYQRSREIVDNPEQHSASTVEYAQVLLQKSEVVLNKHYVSTVSSLLRGGSIRKGIRTYETSVPELRIKLHSNSLLMEQLFRAYVENYQFDSANEVLTLLETSTSSNVNLDRIAELREKFDKLVPLYNELREIKQQIKDASEQYGFAIDDEGTPSTHCSGTVQEQIPEEIVATLEKYDLMHYEFISLFLELSRPGRIKVSDVLAARNS